MEEITFLPAFAPLSPLGLAIFAGSFLLVFLLLRAAGRGLGLGRETERGTEMDLASLILGIGLLCAVLVLAVAGWLVRGRHVPSKRALQSAKSAKEYADSLSPPDEVVKRESVALPPVSPAELPGFTAAERRRLAAHRAGLERRLATARDFQAAAGSLTDALSVALPEISLAGEPRSGEGTATEFTVEGTDGRSIHVRVVPVDDGPGRPPPDAVASGATASIDLHLAGRPANLIIVADGFARDAAERIVAAARYLTPAR